jgi:hypothetical protein
LFSIFTLYKFKTANGYVISWFLEVLPNSMTVDKQYNKNNLRSRNTPRKKPDKIPSFNNNIRILGLSGC